MARMACSSLLLMLSSASARSLLSLRGGMALETEDQKALYALGCNVGRQVGDLDCFSGEEIDTILFGLKEYARSSSNR